MGTSVGLRRTGCQGSEYILLLNDGAVGLRQLQNLLLVTWNGSQFQTMAWRRGAHGLDGTTALLTTEGPGVHLRSVTVRATRTTAAVYPRDHPVSIPVRPQPKPRSYLILRLAPQLVILE